VGSWTGEGADMLSQCGQLDRGWSGHALTVWAAGQGMEWGCSRIADSWAQDGVDTLITVK